MSGPTLNIHKVVTIVFSGGGLPTAIHIWDDPLVGWSLVTVCWVQQVKTLAVPVITDRWVDERYQVLYLPTSQWYSQWKKLVSYQKKHVHVIHAPIILLVWQLLRPFFLEAAHNYVLDVSVIVTMNEKHREVQCWLESVFADEPLPQYEINPRTMEILHQLMKRNKQQDKASGKGVVKKHCVGGLAYFWKLCVLKWWPLLARPLEVCALKFRPPPGGSTTLPSIMQDRLTGMI